jgi:hypothetical protein
VFVGAAVVGAFWQPAIATVIKSESAAVLEIDILRSPTFIEILAQSLRF